MKRAGLTILLVFAGHSLILGAQLAAPAEPKSSPPTPEQQARFARAQQLVKSMDELHKAGKFEQAIPLAEECVTNFRELFGERSAETASAIHQLAYFQFSKGDMEQAKTLNEQALAIRREVLGNEHPHTAVSLRNLGNALAELKQYDRSLECFQEALEIFRATVGEKSVDVAAMLHGIGRSQWALKDNDGAKAHFEQALALYKQLLGDKHPDTALTMQELAGLLVSQERNAEARPYAEQALAINTAAFGKKHPRTVAVLVTLGSACESLSDPAEQQSCYEQALAIRKETLGDDHPDTAEVRHFLARTWSVQGNYAAAIPAYRQSLEHYRHTPGDGQQKAMLLILELGLMHSRMNDPATARTYYEEALSIISDTSGDQDPATIQARVPLAACLGTLGDHAAAQAQFQQALAIRQRSLPEMHADTAYLFHDLGGYLRKTGRNAQARKYLERALAIRKEVMGPTHPRTTNTLVSLATTCVHQRDFTAAQAYCEEAMTIRRQIYPAQHPELADALSNLGFVTACAGDPEKAVSYFEQGLAMTRALFGDDHINNVGMLSNLAVLSALHDDFPAAARFADQSRHIVRRHVGNTLAALPEREQLAYLAKNDGVLSHVALSLGVHGGKDPKIAALSAGWLLNTKGLAHEVLAKRILLARETHDPQLRKIAERLLAVRARQARLILAVPVGGRGPSSSEERGKLARDEESLSRQLAQAGDHATRADPWVELEDLRKKLSPREVFVDIVRLGLRDFEGDTPADLTGSDHYVAWIIPPAAQGEVKIVDLGDAMTIDRAVLALRAAIKAVYTLDSATGRVKSVDEQAVKVFHAAFVHLSRAVLHPIVEQIGQATELTVSPDAGLWLVPWSALLLRDGRFAVEQYEIRHLISGRELVAPAHSRKPGRPMIVANPDFDMDPVKARQRTQAVLAGKKLSEAQIAPTALRTPSAHPIATPLPGTDKEAELVTPSLTRFAGSKPGIFTGQNALEGLVKAVHHPRVALFATHGFFEPALAIPPEERTALDTWVAMSGGAPPARPPSNPLLHCGLLLAGCNDRAHSEAEDGILSGMEIVGIDLRGTELVVLSACETGVGEVRIGESVASVQQAFQLAGAEAIVATLWRVFDVEATLQMTDFFSNLAAGQSKAKSLRNAQLMAIGRMKKQFGSAPLLHWAAFTITGK